MPARRGWSEYHLGFLRVAVQSRTVISGPCLGPRSLWGLCHTHQLVANVSAAVADAHDLNILGIVGDFVVAGAYLTLDAFKVQQIITGQLVHAAPQLFKGVSNNEVFTVGFEVLNWTGRATTQSGLQRTPVTRPSVITSSSTRWRNFSIALPSDAAARTLWAKGSETPVPVPHGTWKRGTEFPCSSADAPPRSAQPTTGVNFTPCPCNHDSFSPAANST